MTHPDVEEIMRPVLELADEAEGNGNMPGEGGWLTTTLNTIKSSVSKLVEERDALAAAMPSEWADAALAYAAEKSARERAEAAERAADANYGRALAGQQKAEAEAAALRTALGYARSWIAGRTAEFASPNFTDRYGYADTGQRLLAAIDAALAEKWEQG